jgi:hypothetical protein
MTPACDLHSARTETIHRDRAIFSVSVRPAPAVGWPSGSDGGGGARSQREVVAEAGVVRAVVGPLSPRWLIGGGLMGVVTRLELRF